jgi:3-hydroxy-9,10-secoandrosta-1,3,5(10)-triene-9,17-dione monooxygenase
MGIAEAPSRAELVRRALDLIPLLQKNALVTEEIRRLPEDSVAALTDAGLLKMRAPVRHGGFECDAGTVVDVVAELARGDGATSLTLAVWLTGTWLVGLFPDEVQDVVFGTPDVRVSSVLDPASVAVAVPAPGGVVLNGRWSFNTGAQQSHWSLNAAAVATPAGEPESVLVAVPLSELEVIDDWHASGLRGSGCVTTVAKDVFVPQERVLPLGRVLQGQHRSRRNADSVTWRTPFTPTVGTAISATAVGLARAARDAFFERLPGRKIGYTTYESQRDAPLTHLQVAEATTRVDEAEFHSHRVARMLDRKAAADEPWTLQERARARLDVGMTCQRAKEAVEILNTASGGSSVYTTVPIQRIERDMQTLALHALIHPNTNLELFGRVLCGLEPNTTYI